jgi:DAPG hydrolase PhiG domain
VQLHDVGKLLDPAPLAIETGYERFDDGVLHVAVRTDLRGCTGEMFEWWFRFRPDTQQYIWWHPVDHEFSEWSEFVEGTHVRSVHHVREAFTGLPAQDVTVQFRDPTEFFDQSAYEKARSNGSISTAVCACVGPGLHAATGEDGRVVGGRLLHVARDTSLGCALRSHFFLGQDMPTMGFAPEAVTEIFSDEFGRALLMHCYNEFTFLSRFLPSLFSAENRETQPVVVPW